MRTSGEFQAVFAALPTTAALLLMAQAPQFTIVAATNEYLRSTLTDKGIVGKPLFAALTDNPFNPEATGVANLRCSLETVIATRAVHRMDVQRYDIQRPDGSWEVRHWAPQNAPVLGEDGNVRFIVHDVRDVTEEVLGREALNRAEQRAARTIERMSDAHALLDRNYTFIAVNPAAERATGKTEAQLLGQSHWDVFPASVDLVGKAYQRVVEEGVEQHLTPHYVGEGYDIHLEIDAYPTDEGGIALFWRDVTERVRATQALRNASVRKDEFLATLAHELRNPLAPLRSGLQILQLNPEAAAAGKTVATMERQLAHMVRLIDDLMDVARISQGKLQLRLERVDLRDIVEAAVEASRPLIESAGHELAVHLPDDPLHVLADATRLVQVVGNLLNNAAKYTPQPGLIELSVGRDGSGVLLRIKDSGVGLPEHELTRIFEPFTQLQGPAAEEAEGGLGLGLSIVQRLIEMHHGSIAADSKGPGLGATFTIWLPLTDGGQGTRSTSQAVPATPSAPKCRVLVVDDNRDAANTFASVLSLLGNEARTVYSGAAAIELARCFKPEVAFCDLGMPGMSGYDVAARLRGDPQLAAIKLVAVTGWGTLESRERALRAGFDLHLAKPVEGAAILAALEELVGPA